LEWHWISPYHESQATFDRQERDIINTLLNAYMIRTFSLLLAGLLLMAGKAQAQSPHFAQPQLQPLPHEQDSAWPGIWVAEDSPFIIKVIRSGSQFSVESIESMGLEWVARNGIIKGDSATIEVEYQGVYGRVLVQLLDSTTAVARAMSCQPEYHVICALVRNQQARFLKQTLQTP
jgi:hypothetical protein